MKGLVAVWVLVAVSFFGALEARAQVVPRLDDAELIFSQGLQAFEAGDFGMAYRRFRLVYDNYGLNRKTTAAHLMAGKSLYRSREYREAADLLTAFIRRYPTSSYIGEAQQTLDLALQQQDRVGRRAQTITLGIILPLGGEDTALAQALFNGVRLAVDEHNRLNVQAPRIRMVFRDTGGDAAKAAAAVRELAGLQASAIVGPLYSGEARAAAEAAERAGVVLVAPLATDEDVSEGRRFVFQANPTITMRGRQMARFALGNLRLSRFGVVAERDGGSISERMGEGFQEELILQGGSVSFYKLLENARGWSQLPQLVGADTLARVQAVYLPVAGSRAESLIEAALVGLDRTGVNVRELGNAEWHDLPNKRLASKYQATYTNDFYVDPTQADVQAFQQAYRALANSLPEAGSVRSRLAFTGYDLTRYLMAQLTSRPERPLREALQAAPMYQGLGIRIDFRNGNVNEALYFHRYRDGQSELVR